MTPRGKHFAALGVGAALLMSTGCGSSDQSKSSGKPLPQSAVATIVQRLDEVQRRFDAATSSGNRGACQDIENDSYKAIDTTVQGLPQDVDPDVRKALEDSLSRLQNLTREGCSNVRAAPPKQDTTPAQTVPQQTLPQEPVAPQHTDTQQTVPDPKKPKKPKKDNGDANGNQPDGTGAPGSNGGTETAPQVGEG